MFMFVFLRRCFAALGCVAFLIVALPGAPAGAQSTRDISIITSVTDQPSPTTHGPDHHHVASPSGSGLLILGYS